MKNILVFCNEEEINLFYTWGTMGIGKLLHQLKRVPVEPIFLKYL